MIYRLFAACLCCCLLSCSSLGSGKSKGIQLAEVRPVAPNFVVISKDLKRKKFDDSFLAVSGNVHTSRSPLDAIRIVPVFDRESRSLGYPEYRLFDIRPGSPYDRLGLKNGDVLIAANDWVIFDPARFKRYVNLLREEPGAHIEIRRAGMPVMLKFNFVD